MISSGDQYPSHPDQRGHVVEAVAAASQARSPADLAARVEKHVGGLDVAVD